MKFTNPVDDIFTEVCDQTPTVEPDYTCPPAPADTDYPPEPGPR